MSDKVYAPDKWGYVWDPSLSPSDNLKKKLENKARVTGTAPEQAPEPPTWDPSLIPDVGSSLTPELEAAYAEQDANVDSVVGNIDVLSAYRKWIGKEVDEKTTGRTESIMVSCPNPSHRDKHPSAWLNAEKKTWYCGGCQEGGDIFDLAAIGMGYDRPGYKTDNNGKTFNDLRRDMAEAYGLKIKIIGGQEVTWMEEEQKSEEPNQAAAELAEGDDSDLSSGLLGPTPGPSDRSTVEQQATEAVETPAPPAPTSFEVDWAEEPEGNPDNNFDDTIYPEIPWKDFVPPDTFLWEYLTATTADDSPEEYHFWHGLVALGSVVGRMVYLDDTVPVYGNLMLCLLGGTGFGKSRSRAWLDTVLTEAAPYKDQGLSVTGCKLVPTPGSGENLIKQFQHVATDPALPNGMMPIYNSVTGVVDYDEFAGLIARAGRQGSTLKPIIQRFADAANRVDTASNSGGTHIAHKPFCTITASTQPKAVRALISKYDADSGFLNRWIFVGGKRKKRESVGGKRSKIKVDLAHAIDKLKEVKAWGAVTREIEFSDDGYQAWDKLFHGVLEPYQLGDQTGLLSRLALALKRLLLLFAINEKKTLVTKADVERVAPFAKYLMDCYQILYLEIGITNDVERDRDLERVLSNLHEKSGNGATASEIKRYMKKYSIAEISRILEGMVKLDLIEVVKPPPGKRGRPTVRYVPVTPLVGEGQ